MKKYTITDPIFGATVLLLLGSADQYNRFMKRVHPRADKAAKDDAACYEHCKREDGSMDRYIWFPEWADDNDHMARLAHECHHAAEEILRYCGVSRTKGAEEAFTYY